MFDSPLLNSLIGSKNAFRCSFQFEFLLNFPCNIIKFHNCHLANASITAFPSPTPYIISVVSKGLQLLAWFRKL